MKKKIGRLLFRIFSILLFVTFTGGTLFFAYGYQFDVEDRVLQKISIIDVVGKMGDLIVYLDGEEVAKALPFQIKNVLPGKHELKVSKDGFLPWIRYVQVNEDIVTIVSDVLPVPEKIGDYIEDLMMLDEFETIIYGDKFFLTYLPGESVLKMILFFDNGTIKEEEVSLYREDFEIIETFPGEKFLIRFNDELHVNKDDIYAFVSFSDREFRIFALPLEIERIRVDLSSKVVFFLKDGTLYVAPFDDLGEEEFGELESFELEAGVDQYDLDYFGHVFYLSSGMLFSSNYEGDAVKLLDQCPMFYTNMAIHSYDDFALLVARGEDETRKLFIVDRRGDLIMLTDNLHGQHSVNSKNEILYINEQGHVFSYNVSLSTKKFVSQLEGEFELVGWFGDDGHLLLKKDGYLTLMNVLDARSLVILEEFGEQKTFVAGKALYYWEGLNLKMLYWQDALEK